MNGRSGHAEWLEMNGYCKATSCLAKCGVTFREDISFASEDHEMIREANATIRQANGPGIFLIVKK
jgi:hypothetical protein